MVPLEWAVFVSASSVKQHLESQNAIMSDYPKGGDVASTRAWLDKKGFTETFVRWEADAILGLSEERILSKVPGERGEMLWGFLNTARQTTGKTSIICSHSSPFALFVVFSSCIIACC